MDENRYKEAYEAYNAVPCPFEKAVLSRNCACRQTLIINIGDREAAGCQSRMAQQNCTTFLELLRHKARFAMQTSDDSFMLPHNKEIRIQCGGLKGLESALLNIGSIDASTTDISAMITASIKKWGALDSVPFSELMPSIASFKGRRKRDRHN